MAAYATMLLMTHPARPAQGTVRALGDAGDGGRTMLPVFNESANRLRFASTCEMAYQHPRVESP
jgi:hypothetical protein